VFTFNNPGDDEETRLLNEEAFSYIIFGREYGKKKKTYHLQGYVELAKQTRLTTATKLLGCHTERRMGTQEQAIEYCKKDGDWIERGTPRNQGERGDLDEVRQAAIDGGMRDVVSWANCQQIRVAEKYLQYNEEKRDSITRVIWLWGVSGIGKSRKARVILDELGYDDYYCKNTPNKWWDGYDGHKAVIIDNYSARWKDWDLDYLLNLCDRYEFRVEFKGGSRQFLAEVIIITTVNHPEYVVDDPDSELSRRIESVTEVTGNS